MNHTVWSTQWVNWCISLQKSRWIWRLSLVLVSMNVFDHFTEIQFSWTFTLKVFTLCRPNNLIFHKQKRCHYAPRLHLSISAFILSFEIQTNATRNDMGTIRNTSDWCGFGPPFDSEIGAKYFRIYKWSKNEIAI